MEDIETVPLPCVQHGWDLLGREHPKEVLIAESEENEDKVPLHPEPAQKKEAAFDPAGCPKHPNA